DVLRVAVNAGSSLGSAGIETGLAPSMTIGTGFFGGSSVGENLQPRHLVQWTRLAYNSDPAEAFGDFAGLDPWLAPAGAVPPYPVASNLGNQRPGPAPDEVCYSSPASRASRVSGASRPELDSLRAEIRRVIIEELQALRRDGLGGLGG